MPCSVTVHPHFFTLYATYPFLPAWKLLLAGASPLTHASEKYKPVTLLEDVIRECEENKESIRLNRGRSDNIYVLIDPYKFPHLVEKIRIAKTHFVEVARGINSLNTGIRDTGKLYAQLEIFKVGNFITPQHGYVPMPL
ncbi:hypothetical protein [Caballeronia mineralivorans]|uniref:hypothetical protein n=1 Tax=Caballeronia mineralivorans TaxID=2010198 RepID=UPI000AFDF6C7|nr:hypothetical protein [Caballeronia mineralivorans]